MEQPVKLRLHVISPVHIGCGEVYEPTSFYIDKSDMKLFAFDPADFVDSLDDEGRREFSDVCCMEDSLLSVMKTIKNRSGSVPAISTVGVTASLAEHYEKVLSMSSFDNKFILERTAYNANGNIPFIPGSSLKGSMRTAYLNHARLLNYSIDADPFRMLKTPDLFPVSDAETKIIYAINVRKKSGEKGRGPFQALEVIVPGAVFEGIMRLDKPQPGSKINNPISASDLFSSLKDFYTKRLAIDNKQLESIGSGKYIKSIIDHLTAFDNSLGKRAFRIRIGRHSGAEALTLEGRRKIKILQQRGKPDKIAPEATTFWLAADSKNETTGMPFGWAVLELVPFKNNLEWLDNPYLDKLREENAQSAVAERQKKEKEALERKKQAQKLEAERLRMEEEKKRQEEEEQKRMEEWNALSDKEKLIHTPAKQGVTEQEVVACFNKLDSLESPVKEQLAEVIRAYYQELGKWDVKAKNKKQYQKVQKLKGILK